MEVTLYVYDDVDNKLKFNSSWLSDSMKFMPECKARRLKRRLYVLFYFYFCFLIFVSFFLILIFFWNFLEFFIF